MKPRYLLAVMLCCFLITGYFDKEALDAQAASTLEAQAMCQTCHTAPLKESALSGTNLKGTAK